MLRVIGRSGYGTMRESFLLSGLTSVVPYCIIH